MKNYYKILYLEPNVSQNEIRKRYKLLALICHPDKQKSNDYNYSDLFNDINEAYQTLSDNTKRCIYDTEYYYYIKNKELENLSNNYLNTFTTILKEKTNLFFNTNKNNINNEKINNIDIYSNYSLEEVKLMVKKFNYKIIISILLNIYIWLIYNY